jgi:hypothetical protein
MSKSLSIDYQPEPTPYTIEDLPRYVEQELNKIAQALENASQPVALSVDEQGNFLVTTIVTWVQVLIGETAGWDVPGGSWDPTTGIYTVPQQGLYSVNAQLEVSPFGAGNKTYYAGLRLYRDRGGVVEFVESTDGGDDAIPLGVTISGLLPLLQGDRLGLEMTIVHDQFSGTAPYNVAMQIKRESS